MPLIFCAFFSSFCSAAPEARPPRRRIVLQYCWWPMGASFSATCRTPSSEITRGSKSIITAWLAVSISVRRTPGSSRSGTGKRLSSDLLWSFVAAELSFRIRYKIRRISLMAPQGLATSNLFLRSLLKTWL